MKRKWRLYLDTSVFGGCFDAAEGWDVDSPPGSGLLRGGHRGVAHQRGAGR